MQRLRWLILGAAGLVVAGLLVWWATTRQPAGERAVTIGADLPLSGPMAFYGQEVKRGLDLALSGNRIVKVAYEDNHSNARDAVTVFTKFADRGDVPLVVSSNTPLSAPLRELARQRQVILLALVTGATGFTADNPWVFRDAITQPLQGPPLAEYAFTTLGARRAATLVVNDDYGLDGAAAFSKALEALGGTIAAADTFETRDTDLRAQLTKIKTARPDVLFVVGREQNLIAAVVQAFQLEVAPWVLSVNAFDSDTVIKGVGPAGEKVVFTSYYVNLDGTAEGRSFRERFVAAFGAEPSIYAIDAYCAGRYLAPLLEAGGTDSAKLRDALAALEVDSIKGRIEVTPEREILPPLGLYTVKGAQKVLLKSLAGG